MLGNLSERLRIAQRDKRIVGKLSQRYAFPSGIPVSLGHSHAHLLIVQQDGTRRHACKDGPVFDSKEVDWDA